MEDQFWHPGCPGESAPNLKLSDSQFPPPVGPLRESGGDDSSSQEDERFAKMRLAEQTSMTDRIFGRMGQAFQPGASAAGHSSNTNCNQPLIISATF